MRCLEQVTSICKGRDSKSITLCGSGGLIAEFNLRNGHQSGVYPQMFPSLDRIFIICKIKDTVYAIGTQNGFYLVDLKLKRFMMTALKGMLIIGMTVV